MHPSGNFSKKGKNHAIMKAGLYKGVGSQC